MFESGGRLIPSIVMIDPELDQIASFRRIFHQFDTVKFFAMNDMNLGLIETGRFAADLVIAEICYTNAALSYPSTDLCFPSAPYHDSEHDGKLVDTIRDIRPDAKIIIRSTETREEVIHRYLTRYKVNAYFKKGESGILDVVRKAFELLGDPWPAHPYEQNSRKKNLEKIMPIVLAIDSDAGIRSCVEMIFREEMQGFTVLTALNGEQGIKLAQEHPIDLIILSLFLDAPIKGDEIIREVKRLHPGIKVIISSALEINKFHFWEKGWGIANRIREAGYDAYLVKPWEPLQFIRIVKDVLEGTMATLLVIDDEKDICQCVEDIFKEEEPRFSVLKADNGLDGIELVRKHKPDVILLDLQLQAAMDGIEVLKQIKQLHPEGKVAILTGYGADEEALVNKWGVDAYAVKPFTPYELLGLVKKLFRQKERR